MRSVSVVVVALSEHTLGTVWFITLPGARFNSCMLLAVCLLYFSAYFPSFCLRLVPTYIFCVHVFIFLFCVFSVFQYYFGSFIRILLIVLFSFLLNLPGFFPFVILLYFSLSHFMYLLFTLFGFLLHFPYLFPCIFFWSLSAWCSCYFYFL